MAELSLWLSAVLVGIAMLAWVWSRRGRQSRSTGTPTIQPAMPFPPPPPPPARAARPDILAVDGVDLVVLDGTTLGFGPPWVIRAKLKLGPGQQKFVEELVREKRVVRAVLFRVDCDPVCGKAKAERGGLFRDKQGVACASLELIGVEGLVHIQGSATDG